MQEGTATSIFGPLEGVFVPCCCSTTTYLPGCFLSWKPLIVMVGLN